MTLRDWLILFVAPEGVITAGLVLVLWWTSAFTRMKSWPWFVFAFLYFALGAVLWWLMGIAVIVAPVLVGIGFAQMWRRRRALEMTEERA